MITPENKAAPGDPLRVNARRWNDAMAAGAALRQSALSREGGPVGPGFPSSGTVLVKSKVTGNPVPSFGVLKLGTAPVLPADSTPTFQSWIAFEGTTPSASNDRFVITLQILRENEIGEAVVAGPVWAWVNVLVASHTHAAPTPGVNTKLTSGTSGVPILYKPSGTGDKWCYVLLPAEPASLEEVRWYKVTNSPFAGSCVQSTYDAGTQTWTDGSETTYLLRLPNGESPVLGKRYAAKYAGPEGPYSAFMTGFVGVDVQSSGATPVENNVQVLQFQDPGLFFTFTASGNNKVTVGQTGYLCLTDHLRVGDNVANNAPFRIEKQTDQTVLVKFSNYQGMDAAYVYVTGSASAGGIDWRLGHKVVASPGYNVIPLRVVMPAPNKSSPTAGTFQVGAAVGTGYHAGIGYIYDPTWADTDDCYFYCNNQYGKSGTQGGMIFSGGIWVGGSFTGGGGGTGTVTSVGVTGGSTGFTFSNSPVTGAGTMEMSGTLNVANGGTGATTPAQALANLGALSQATADARYPLRTDPDPYPQYTTQAESDARYPLKTDPDPYPQYLTPAEANALYQAADAGLTSLATAASPGSLYYLSADDVWSPVTVGAGLTFAGGTLSAAGGFTGTVP